MTQPLPVNEGEPRSPRVFVAFAQPEGPANQIYLKTQQDGGVLFYLAASLDRPLQQVFDYYAYNGFLTESLFVKMCVETKLFPAEKDPDPLQYIFKNVAKGERYLVILVLSRLFAAALRLPAEYESFLQLLHLLSRLKFRKANLPEQDAVNALVAHLLHMSPRLQRRHKLVNCGIQVSPDLEEKAIEATVELKEVAVDSEPKLQDQIIQEQTPTREAGVAAVVETRETGEQTNVDTVDVSVQVDIQKEIEELKRKEEEELRKMEEEELRREEEEREAREEERKAKEEERKAKEKERKAKEKERKAKEEEKRKQKEGEEAEARTNFKDCETQTVFAGDEALKRLESRQPPDVLTSLRGEQDSLLYRAFCLYSEFVPEACENLLSEVNCALMFRDGDLMAVPLHPAIRGLPPALAREYFNMVIGQRKAEEKKQQEEAAPSFEVPAQEHGKVSAAGLNYKEFKALVFLASQWICETQNSYWSFMRIVRDRLLPALFRGEPWLQQASPELKQIRSARRQQAAASSSEGSDVETAEETNKTSSSSSTSSSETGRSTSSSTTSGYSARHPLEENRGRPKVYGGYDDGEPIGTENVFYDTDSSADTEDSGALTAAAAEGQRQRGPSFAAPARKHHEGFW
ncbi:hypothetical protein Efla_003412 [Eimeria flavescens]